MAPRRSQLSVGNFSRRVFRHAKCGADSGNVIRYQQCALKRQPHFTIPVQLRSPAELRNTYSTAPGPSYLEIHSHHWSTGSSDDRPHLIREKMFALLDEIIAARKADH